MTNANDVRQSTNYFLDFFAIFGALANATTNNKTNLKVFSTNRLNRLITRRQIAKKKRAPGLVPLEQKQ